MDSQNPSKSQMHDENENHQQINEDDMDDLDDLGLFHKSSLHNKQQLTLPQVVQETFNAKRQIDEKSTRVNQYIEIGKIGKGAFAEVIKVQYNNEYYAMKVYGLMKLKSMKFYAADGNFADSEQMFRNEIEILKCLSHGNLVKCHQILYGGNYAYLVMENCDLGQIMEWSDQKHDFIRSKKVIDYLSKKYKIESIEDITRLIFLQLAMGIQYLHKNSISNRDIKIDNILCKITEIQGQDIKIADFTTVRYSKDDISYFTCGTAGFRGPEIQNAGSDGYSCKALDIWSFGISLYTYFYENFPFMDSTDYAIEMRAQKEELKYGENSPQWLIQVIRKTTMKKWSDRIDINEVIHILTGIEIEK